MRQTFQVAQQDIAHAMISIVGLGHYELRVNGKKLGTRVVDPGWTNYNVTCLYATYTNFTLLPGSKNAIGVMLGNGMYNVPGKDVYGHPVRYTKFTGSFGPRTLLFQLDVTSGHSTVNLPVWAD